MEILLDFAFVFPLFFFAFLALSLSTTFYFGKNKGNRLTVPLFGASKTCIRIHVQI